MSDITIYTQDGQITRWVDCLDKFHALQPEPGEAYLVGRVSNQTHYIDVVTGQPVKKLPQPTPDHAFDYTTKQWTDPRTLQDLKATKRSYINVSRLQANQTSFSYEGKQIACDALSRGDIDATNGQINNLGTLPANWRGAWKTLDNSYVPIPDVETWKLFYSIMFAQGDANFEHAQRLKAQLEAATTREEIDLVVW